MDAERVATDHCITTITTITHRDGHSESTYTKSDTIPFSEQQQQQQQQGRSPIQHNNSLASSVNSYSQRDSRVQSIYDRYLYRQESLRQQALHRLPSTNTPRRAAAQLHIIEEMASPLHNPHYGRPTQANAYKNRQSRNEATGDSAWAGMMMGGDYSDDSDSERSDDGRGRIPSPSSRGAATTAPGGSARASWSSRAAAVGSRPPDSASQNPPTLKLLGLRSVKEGGAPLGHHGQELSGQSSNHSPLLSPQKASPAYDSRAQSSRIEPNNGRIQSTSDYGDEPNRHGSYIDFAAPPKSNGPPRGYALQDEPLRVATNMLEPPKSPNGDRPISPRTALTQQLGLATPQPAQPSPRSPQHRPEANDYFPPYSPAQSGFPRDLVPGGPAGTQQSYSNQRQMSPSQASFPQSMPLQRGVNGPASQHPATMPTPIKTGPPVPMPIPLPSPVYPQFAGSPLSDPPINGRGPPTMDNARMPRPGRPGFSDSPQVGGRNMKRQPSLLRRSMAFITGSAPMPSQQGGYPQQQGQQGGPRRKNSIFRKSMAFLTGRPVPAEQAPQTLGSSDDHDAAQPRVAGFIEEKPRNRKSEYLGASGMGDEWDYNGYGAKFWKRFSTAQRLEQQGANKDSEAFRRKMERRRKGIMCMSLFGGLCIIGAVIAVVIWREQVNATAVPGAVAREENGVFSSSTSGGVNVKNGIATSQDTSYTSQTDYGSSMARATTSSRKHHTSTRGYRRGITLPASPTLTAQQIQRDVLDTARSAHVGGPHPLPRSVHGEGSRKRRLEH